MTATVIRDFRAEDYPALAALAGSTHPDAPRTADGLGREDRTRPQHCRWGRVVAEVDGVLAGAGIFDQNPGMYHPRIFHVDVMVAPEHRGKGLGTALHDRLLDLLEPHRPIERLGRVRADDEAACRFATGLGYRETKRDFISVLDLDTFDPREWWTYVDDASAQGLRFVTLTDVRDDPAMVRAYWEQFSAVRADVPRSLPPTPIDLDFFTTEVVDSPEAVADATWLAFDGSRCVGFTQVYASEASAELETGLTGIDRAYRRRGLATALKVRSLAAAKAAGAPSIRTDNDTRNEAMIAANVRLGFSPRPANITVASKPPADHDH
jgi:RimJ/RimL family protein N-acetyltransferase